MNAKELFQTGQLDEAIAAAVEHVKRHPKDIGQRNFLCTLLCFAGNIERADKQLDAIGQQELKAAAEVALFRQLLRAEEARTQFFAEGRLPEFVAEPGEHVKRHLEASIYVREGDGAKAAALLDEARQSRPAVSGDCGGEAFDDLCDMDDLTASVFEVLTSTGKYYWIPMETVELIEFRPPEQPRDLLWRRVRMVVQGGPDGEVFLPTCYFGSHADEDVRIRLGRYTDWRGGDGSPVRGFGLRTFLVGEEAKSVMELEQITFNVAQLPDDEPAEGEASES
jgi:type VI secretion system protein ImpE